MRFVTEIHYTGCRSCEIEADSAEAAVHFARERHHASSIAGPEDVEEITWARTVKVSGARSAAAMNTDDRAALRFANAVELLGANLEEDGPDEEALRLADQVGVCPGCGFNVADSGADEDCDNAEGCGALNGSAALPFEHAKLRRLLLSYADAITTRAYEDAQQAVADLTRDLRALPKRRHAPVSPDGPPDDPRFQIEITLGEHMRLHLGLTYATRANPLDPGNLALRDRLDEIADRALLAAGEGS